MTKDRDESVAAAGIPRRRLLAGSAVTAAGIWAAPAITTMSRAIASPGSAAPNTCGPQGHDGYPTCTTGDYSQCGNEGALDYCFCGTDTEGRLHCFDNEFCDDPQATACATSADCPSGLYCNANSCGQVCVPCCGAPVAPNVVKPGSGTRKTAVTGKR